MGHEGYQWRVAPGQRISRILELVGKDIAEEVDREDFDLAVRNLLGMITAHVTAQALGVREQLGAFGWIHAALLSLILWRVW